MYALIPAGGSGTRLWPQSRQKFPKQLLSLFDGDSLIQTTIKRISKRIPKENIVIITEQTHAQEMKDQLPNVPDENFLIEPIRRDTAPVIGLGVFSVYKKDPKAVVASLHADHAILKEDAFLEILEIAEEVALSSDVVVTIGIRPTHPSTAYGYIKSGSEMDRIKGNSIYRVDQFVEKPAKEKAEKFIHTGEYFWNAGIFIARAEVLIELYKKHLPEVYEGLKMITEISDKEIRQEKLDEIYPTFKKVPIDTAIMEKSSEIVVIPADIDWRDIGTWDVVSEMEKSLGLKAGRSVSIDSSNNLVVSNRESVVGLIGVHDMIVVHTDDATLVCPFSDATRVKELVAKLKKEGYEDYV